MPTTRPMAPQADESDLAYRGTHAVNLHGSGRPRRAGPGSGDAGHVTADLLGRRARRAPQVGQFGHASPHPGDPPVLDDLRDLGGVLADQPGRVGEVGEGVVAGAVPAGPPLRGDAVVAQPAEAPHEVVDGRHLVRHVVERGPLRLVEGDAVVVGVAAQERHPVLGPVGDAHARGRRSRRRPTRRCRWC